MYLPKDVWISCVLNRVSLIDLAHLQATCRQLRKIISTHETFKTELDIWKNSSFENCLADYVETGHLDIVKLALAKGRGGTLSHKRCAIDCAMRNGDFNIMVHLIDVFKLSWSHVVQEAAKRGYIEMVKMFIAEKSNKKGHWKDALRGAICGNNYEALNLIMNNLPADVSHQIDWATLCGYATSVMNSHIKNKLVKASF